MQFAKLFAGLLLLGTLMATGIHQAWAGSTCRCSSCGPVGGATGKQGCCGCGLFRSRCTSCNSASQRCSSGNTLGFGYANCK
jgi:hypothetical protein